MCAAKILNNLISVFILFKTIKFTLCCSCQKLAVIFIAQDWHIVFLFQVQSWLLENYSCPCTIILKFQMGLVARKLDFIACEQQGGNNWDSIKCKILP